MNVLIIEDERHNADRLTRLLNSSFDEITVYGPLPSIADIRRFFNEPERIDLILADIRLSDGLSFDALKDIPGDIPVIFTTAYDEYALKAFHYNGIAYLLKPIDKEELVEAVEKSRRLTAPSATKEIAEIYRLLQGKPEVYRQRFLVAEKDGYITVRYPKSATSPQSQDLHACILKTRGNITSTWLSMILTRNSTLCSFSGRPASR